MDVKHYREKIEELELKKKEAELTAQQKHIWLEPGDPRRPQGMKNVAVTYCKNCLETRCVLNVKEKCRGARNNAILQTRWSAKDLKKESKDTDRE